MPELPEVEFMTQYLIDAGIENNKIVGMSHVGKLSALKSLWVSDSDVPPDFFNLLIGSTIKRIRRRAKFIFWEMDTGTLLIHHKWTGFWSIRNNPISFNLMEYPRDSDNMKDVHFIVTLEDGRELLWHDIRCLGELHFYNECKPSEIARLNKFGPEVIETACIGEEYRTLVWTRQRFFARLAHRNIVIKDFLLDQKEQAGLGNIYACEALFLAGIHPFSRTRVVLESGRAELLFQSAQSIMLKALQNNLLYKQYINVFRKEYCVTCGFFISREERHGQGTYFCRECQKTEPLLGD